MDAGGAAGVVIMSALDTLRAIARSDTARSPGNERNETYEQTPQQAPVSSLNSFVSSPGTLDADDLDERAALMEVGAGVPRRWAEGYAALSSMPAPTGFTPERWRRIVDATGAFLDHWAAEAIRCCWSELDVFGANPDRPDARFDAMGLVLLLDRAEVASIDSEGATLKTNSGSELRFRRRPLPGDTVSLWDLATCPASALK